MDRSSIYDQAPLISHPTRASSTIGKRIRESADFTIEPFELEPEVISPQSWFDPQRLAFRSILLLLICGTTVGCYFSYDSTAVVATKLMEHVKISQAEFGMLYSIYSIPNLILPLIGGILVDRIGVRFGLILFLSLIAVGTGIVAVAPFTSNPFVVMLVGRFLFGLGSESSFVAQDTFCVVWFNGRSLALAMGIIASVERATEVITFNTLTSSFFADYRWALIFTFLTCVASLIFGIFACLMDKWGIKALHDRGVVVKRDTEEKFHYSDIKKFNASYWILCVVMFSYYSSVFPFLSFGSDFLQIKYGYTELEAGRVMSLLGLVSMLLSPLFGYLIDMFGRRIHLINAGNIILGTALLILYGTDIHPIWPTTMIGIAYAVIPAALWPCIPLVVEEKAFGTASGLALSLSNIGMIPTFYLLGQLVDRSHSVEQSLLLLTGIVIIGLIGGFAWILIDRNLGSTCDLPVLANESEDEADSESNQLSESSV